MKTFVKLLLFCVIYLSLPTSGIAQKKVFFDKNWEKTKEKNAVFYRVITPEGSNFLVQDYFLAENQLQMEGHYTGKDLTNEEKTGTFTYYYKNGQKSAEGEFKKGKQEGEWNEWYKDGVKKASGSYEKGDREGEWTYFHKNGQTKSKGIWLKDEKDGIWHYIYDTGEKYQDYTYSKGKIDGPFFEYFKGGKLKEKGSYEKDSLVGSHEEYWENGNLASKGEYNDNKRNGSWEWFHENGKTSCKVDYKNGKFLTGNFFNEEGVKQSNKIYKDDLVEPLEYTGGTDAMYALIGKQIGKKVDLQGAKAAEYYFNGYISLDIDEKGNITDREWILPDLDGETFEDTWEMVENINSAIDDFPRFKPRIAYNRKTKSKYYFYYIVDFKKVKIK